MPRRLAIVLFVALAVFGCIAAVGTASTERRGSALRNVEITTAFSPNGDGSIDTAVIAMRPRDDGQISLRILDDDGATVREVANVNPDDGTVEFTWDGMGDSGTPVDDGAYHLEVDVDDNTMSVPTRITVDTEPPAITCTEFDFRRVDTLGVLRIHVTADDATDYAVQDDAGTDLEIIRRIRNTDKVSGNAFPACGPPVLVIDVPDPDQLTTPTLMVSDRAGNTVNVQYQPGGFADSQAPADDRPAGDPFGDANEATG